MRARPPQNTSTMFSDLLLIVLGVIVLQITTAPVRGVLEEERVVPDLAATSTSDTVAMHIIARKSSDGALRLWLDAEPVSHAALERALEQYEPAGDAQRVLLELDAELTYGEASRLKASLHERGVVFLERRQAPAAKP